MGATFIRGSYLATDMNIGICVRELRNDKYSKPYIGGMEVMQEQARSRCDDDDASYSGGVNTIGFRRGPNMSEKSYAEIEKYIDQRTEYLDKRAGEIITLGKVGSIIVKTSIQEEKLPPFDSRYYLHQSKNGPAVLLTEMQLGCDMMRIVAEGKVTELRAKANKLLRDNKYATNYYIVGREKCYLATGDAKFQKKTTRMSNDSTLVLPVYKYIYYGWAAE